MYEFIMFLIALIIFAMGFVFGVLWQPERSSDINIIEPMFDGKGNIKRFRRKA